MSADTLSGINVFRNLRYCLPISNSYVWASPELVGKGPFKCFSGHGFEFWGSMSISNVPITANYGNVLKYFKLMWIKCRGA